MRDDWTAAMKRTLLKSAALTSESKPGRLGDLMENEFFMTRKLTKSFSMDFSTAC